MNILKKIKRFLQKSKGKILCCLTIVSILLGMLTVFSSANTVPGEDYVYKPYDVYFPYPQFAGFSFDYKNRATPTVINTGRVYNTANYIYGVDSSAGNFSDPSFDYWWSDGFYIQYPRSDPYGTLEGNTFKFSSRLRYYNPGSSLLNPGDVLLWSNLMVTSDVERYMTGDSLTLYYNDFVFSRNNSWIDTPYAVVSRELSSGSSVSSSIDAEIYYKFDYVAFNNFTGQAVTQSVSTYKSVDNWSYTLWGSDAQYLTFNAIPYDWLNSFFNSNPDFDYVYIKSSACNLRVYDPSNVSSHFRNVNFYNYLLTDEAYTKLGLNVSDYVNDIRGYEGLRDDLLAADFGSWITSAVGSFMSFEIFPGFSFSLILSVLVGALMFFFFLRLFAGG